MSRIIKAILLDKNTIRIEENAEAGDLIDLSGLTNIDTTQIENAIREGKDKEYEKQLKKALSDQKSRFELEKDAAIKVAEEKKNEKIKLLEKELSNKDADKELALERIRGEYKTEIAKYNEQIKSFEKDKELAVKDAIEKQKIEINRLEQANALKNAEKDKAILEKEVELENKFKKLLDEKREEFEKELKEKSAEYDALKVEYGVLKETKIRMNNKEIGEDLETFSNDVVNKLMQIGFENCTWEKDNDPIRDYGETKGTKADFIFKVFLDEKHEGEPLTSICLEMKNESIVSDFRMKNSAHYDKLDSDRKKKQCKYALLVSNLEFENENIPPIMKVSNYPDMYMVRPAYLTTFLTIITSLTMKFKDIILADRNKKLELASINDFISEFDKLKNTYLDKPLDSLQKEIEGIKKANSSIQDAVAKINTHCDNVVSKYLNEITDKLDKYYKGIIKSYKNNLKQK